MVEAVVVEVVEVLVGVEFEGAELFEVGVGELGVEEGEASGAEVVDEGDEADFAGVGAAEVGAGEHGLAAEDRAEGDAVEPADEDGGRVGDGCGGAWDPGFDAVGVAGAVEEFEGADDVGAEPGIGSPGGGLGAGADDAVEGVVGGNAEAALAHARAERAWDVETVVEGDDGAAAGLDPADGVALVHREPALAVHGEDGFDERALGRGERGRRRLGREGGHGGRWWGWRISMTDVRDIARGYVFVTAWPKGRGDAAMAGLLSRVFRVGAYEAVAAAERAAPTLVFRGDVGVCEAGVRALVEAGAGVIGMRREDLRARVEPVALRALRPALGAPEPMYMGEVARVAAAEPVVVRARDIRLLVRGRTRAVGGEVVDTTMPGSMGRMMRARVEPLTGVPIPADGLVRGRSATFVEVLDLHLRDGSQYRCDGSVFRFRETLGEASGLSDKDNADRLALRLGEESPRAVIDMGFEDATWTTALLGDCMSLRASRGGTDRRGMLAFAIYSAVLGVARAVARGKRAAWA